MTQLSFRMLTAAALVFMLLTFASGMANAQVDELSTPFVVRKINGTIFFGDNKPLARATINIGIGNSESFEVDSGTDGKFEMRPFKWLGPFVWNTDLRPGTYRFSVRKDGFHTTVGTIIVSSKAPEQSVVNVVIKPNDDYHGEELGTPPTEQLLPSSDTIATPADHKHYPQKYAAIYVPISLAAGRVRTTEFPVEKAWYDIMLQVEKPLPFREMQCKVGATNGPLEERDCDGNPSLIQAEWTVWADGHIIHWGSVPKCGCQFTDESIRKLIGSFPGEAGKQYVVQVHFTKDGTSLNIANPHLIVIKSKEMW